VIAAGDGEPRWTMRARTAVVALSLALVFAAGFSAVRSTNFGGYDEWLVVSLTSRGIVSFPYASRPLALVWALPGVLGLPSSLGAYLLAHSAWLFLSGVVVLAIARRLAPGAPRLAVLAAAFALTWAPLDPHRLNPLNNLEYSGATLAALVALLLLLEWAAGGRVLFLAGAFLSACVAAGSYEGTLGLLAPGGVVLLLALGEHRRRPASVALAGWAVALAGVATAVALPLVGSPAGSYQLSGLGLSLEPGGVLARLAQQAGWHLGPLAARPPLWSGRMVVAAAAMALALVASPAGEGVSRRRLALLALAGLGLGLTAWSLMLLTPATVAPAKMQGLSAPGFGLMLSASALLVASLLPERARLPATLALSCGLVALGTARTLALQREWDERSAYPAQRLLLGRLVALAPDLREGTLVVLQDADGVFPATFTFRHAVSYLYAGRAAGLVHRGHDFLYPARFGEDGVESLPWPVVREAWREPAHVYGYDALVVLRQARGELTLERAWPADLPSAPGAAGYAPLARIVRSGRRASVPGE
jgi:hypothetical protein